MLKPIRSKKEYKAALNRIYDLFRSELKVNSDEYNELDIISILVENYESKRFAIELPDPIEAIKFRLEQLNMELSALVEILGSKSRASEILNKNGYNIKFIIFVRIYFKFILHQIINSIQCC